MFEDDIFAINMEGKRLDAYSAKELASFLIEYANKITANKEVPESYFHTHEGQISYYCHKYLYEFLERKNEKSFLDEINSDMAQMPFQLHLVTEKDDSPLQRMFVWYQTKMPTPNQSVLFAFANANSTGKLNNLKSCEGNKCKRFFLGRKNKTWCSDSCSSKYRMRKKRREDFLKKNATP
jgi:hypothetical protein